MTAPDAEALLVERADAAVLDAANLQQVMQSLQAWQAGVDRVLEAGLQLPDCLEAESPLAQQIAAAHTLMQDSQLRWRQQSAELRPGQMLAQGFAQELVLLVFGKFNAGKSSLCNFFGTRFASHARPVRYFHVDSGRVVETAQPLREGATETTACLQGVRLGQRLVLVDTPGLHSVTPENAALTQRFTDSADGVLWLTSSTSPGQVQELEELSRELHRSKPLLPVITRSDVLEEDEVDGEICKLLCNKSAENRLLQEADVQTRARDQLERMGVDPALLQSPVSLSVHAAVAQGATPEALADAGMQRLYAALVAMLQPAQRYKQRKPAEMVLHLLQEKVMGTVGQEILPRLAELASCLARENEALLGLKSHLVRAAWRQAIPELPMLMDQHANDRGALGRAVSQLAQTAMDHAIGTQLGHYVLARPIEDGASIEIPQQESDPDRLFASLQAGIQARLTEGFGQLLDQGAASLAPLAKQIQDLQAGLRKSSQDLQALAQKIRETNAIE